MGTPALYMKPQKVSIFQTKWSKSVCVSFKNITKLMSCGVVSGLSLNPSNKCRCGRGEEGGLHGYQRHWEY